ncbi:hypothetical protein AHAS_Ahas07G0111600 [Arachis hypogaea]
MCYKTIPSNIQSILLSLTLMPLMSFLYLGFTRALHIIRSLMDLDILILYTPRTRLFPRWTQLTSMHLSMYLSGIFF